MPPMLFFGGRGMARGKGCCKGERVPVEPRKVISSNLGSIFIQKLSGMLHENQWWHFP